MPRLGDVAPDEEIQPLNRRRQAVAYPGGGGDGQSRILYAVVLFVCLIWILPNFFFRVRTCLECFYLTSFALGCCSFCINTTTFSLLS